jgi:hypothetical protein
VPTRLEAAYNAQVLDVRKKVAGYAARQWAGLGAWRDADAEKFIAALTPRVESGQARIAQLTDAYIARAGATILGTPIRRGTVAPATTLALRGVPADQVYQRPFTTMRMKLGKGQSLDAAVTAGAARLGSLVLSGMQLAATHSAQKAMTRGGVETYERYLVGEVNCGLCIIASTQRYWRGNLLAIHPGCDCGVRPSDGDPGQQVLHPATLEEMHDAVSAQFGQSDRGARYIDGLNSRSDYLDLVVTKQHGELGPLLTWRDQHFTSLADIVA